MRTILGYLPFMALSAALVAACASPDTEGKTGEAESALAPGCVTIRRGGSGNVYDTHLSPGNGSWAAGGYSGMWTGGNYRSAIGFDLSPVPANANVISSTLHVYSSWNSDASPIEVHAINTPWSEATAVNSTLGGTAHYEAAVLGSFTANWGADGHRNVDITGITKDWLSGATANNGVMLVQPTGSNHFFTTSEGGTASQRPSLTVCWDGEINVDDCAPNPCQNGGTCTDGVNSYTCACPAGFSGANCEIDVNDCADDPCWNGGICVDGMNSYTCQCTSDWTGPNCLDPAGVNECADGGPCFTGTCVDLPDGFLCECPPDWSGTYCDDHNDCVEDPCWNGGTCVDGMNSYTCQCTSDWTGPNCLDPAGVNECADGGPCFTGTCVDLPDGFLCECPPDWSGTYCDDHNDCVEDPCWNGGTCVDLPNGVLCECPAGYVGTVCEDYNECVDSPCLNGGTCVNNYGGFSCDCQGGWSGGVCDVPPNPCDAAPCQHGACTPSVVEGAYTCSCDSGWTGTNCDVPATCPCSGRWEWETALQEVVSCGSGVGSYAGYDADGAMVVQLAAATCMANEYDLSLPVYENWEVYACIAEIQAHCLPQ